MQRSGILYTPFAPVHPWQKEIMAFTAYEANAMDK
jgi:hypothetical protein